jgi:tRNA modification GTPase
MSLTSQTLDLDDTIAAIASAAGGALRGIVRMSGPQAIAVAGRVFVADDGSDLAKLRSAACVSGKILLPRLLGEVPARAYVWPGRRSYTRQPSVELHTLGSPPILDAVLEAVCDGGARLARPGEFTLRAFLAGRLDLTQAEAVLGVIDARGENELKAALTQLAGGLAGPLGKLRERLLDVLAHLEAGLDFADEEIEFISPRELDEQLAAAASQVAILASRMQSRGQAGELPRVVLIGEPNAGKSSLFNALVGRSAAIVSPQAGTTRDFVSCPIRLPGGECLLIDTAGMQSPGGHAVPEAAAQAMASEQERQAAATVLCLDASRPVTEWEQARLAQVPEAPRVVAWTKCDLAQRRSMPKLIGQSIETSSRTLVGLEALQRAMAAALGESRGEGGAVASTASRCRESLDEAAAALRRARELVTAGRSEELVAAEVRIALDGLGQVVGAVYTDDVLDRVFSRFCIGK